MGMLCSKRLEETVRGEKREGWEGSSKWLSEDRETGEHTHTHCIISPLALDVCMRCECVCMYCLVCGS